MATEMCVKQRWLEAERRKRSKMEKVKLNAEVVSADHSKVEFEFGRVQAKFSMSGSGGIQRKLKLKEGDKINLTIEKK